MAAQSYNHVIGIDDAPFDQNRAGNVLVVGAVFDGPRLDGVLSTKVRRDGSNATRALARMVQASRFYAQTQLLLLQGIALAGFNVVDLRGLADGLGIPIIVVTRKRPDLEKVRRALLEHVSGGLRKWRLIEQAGPMEPAAGLFVQRAGVSLIDAQTLLTRLAVHGKMPEPLRCAHMIAGGVVAGESRHRA